MAVIQNIWIESHEMPHPILIKKKKNLEKLATHLK